MSNLRSHALTEFRSAGWMDENGVFEDDMQRMICEYRHSDAEPKQPPQNEKGFL